jgi:hypothetical protein
MKYCKKYVKKVEVPLKFLGWEEFFLAGLELEPSGMLEHHANML